MLRINVGKTALYVFVHSNYDNSYIAAVQPIVIPPHYRGKLKYFSKLDFC